MSDTHPLAVALTGLTGELSRLLADVGDKASALEGDVAGPILQAIRVGHVRIAAVEKRAIELAKVAYEKPADKPAPARAKRVSAKGAA
jgi:hypothetical protein